MDKKEKIFYRLTSDFSYLFSKGFDVVGVFLQGSQNYHLDYDGSDIDTKAIVLPEFNDFVLNKSPISTTHEFENKEHLDIKDIRLMFDCFKKQNINFLEILFTEYFILNPKYEDLFRPLMNNAEEIAHYNNYAGINCIAGMVFEKRKALTHRYEGLADKIDKYGFDCYTEDTKFLTDSGWKYYSQINDNDLLGTFNIKTKTIEYQNFDDRICRYYDGIIYEVDKWHTNFAVTPNHNILSSPIVNINKNGVAYKEELSDWGLQTIKSIVDVPRFSNSLKNRHLAIIENQNSDLLLYDNFEITDDILKLLGAFISDGAINFRKNKLKCITVYQTNIQNKHNLDFIEMMDNIKSVKLSKYKYKSRKNPQNFEIMWSTHDKTICNLFYKWCNHLSHNKKLPPFINKLSKRQCNILLNSLILGDGTEQASRRVYYTTSLKLAEEVQLLSFYSGHFATLMGGENGYSYPQNKNHFKNTKPIYQVAIKRVSYTPKNCHFLIGDCVNTFDYKGNVVCFSVPNNVLITQRKGKIAIQGNCKQLHHILRCREFLERFCDGVSYKECLIPSNTKYLIEVKKNPLLYSLNEAISLADKAVEETEDIKKKYMETHAVSINKNVEILLNDTLCKVLKRKFINNIKEEG